MLRQIRYSIGFSQAQLAKALDVSQSAITHIETGKRIPSPSLARRIVRLATKYGVECSMDDIYSIEVDDRPPTRRATDPQEAV